MGRKAGYKTNKLLPFIQATNILDPIETALYASQAEELGHWVRSLGTQVGEASQLLVCFVQGEHCQLAQHATLCTGTTFSLFPQQLPWAAPSAINYLVCVWSPCTSGGTLLASHPAARFGSGRCHVQCGSMPLFLAKGRNEGWERGASLTCSCVDPLWRMSCCTCEA